MIPTVDQVRDTFPDWTQGQCRAYRRGIHAARNDDISLLQKPPHYYYGAADELGEDAEREDWFEWIEDWRIQGQWWESD